jgi:hypothetical protein
MPENFGRQVLLHAYVGARPWAHKGAEGGLPAAAPAGRRLKIAKTRRTQGGRPWGAVESPTVAIWAGTIRFVADWMAGGRAGETEWRQSVLKCLLSDLSNWCTVVGVTVWSHGQAKVNQWYMGNFLIFNSDGQVCIGRRARRGI